MTFTPKVIMGDQERAIQFSVWQGTQSGRFQGIPPTNRRVRLTIAGLYRARDGHLVELEIVLDSVSVLYQLGILPRMDPLPAAMRPFLRLRARMQKEK
jgi:predicted ester cyclase